MKEKVLILGGTEFVGRLLVEALAKDETKEVYLFNRGKTNPHLFPGIKRIIGDRESDDIEKIRNHKWDYVVDFSSYYPKSLQKTIEQINRDVKKYLYISTISVYAFDEYDARSLIGEDFQKVTCSEEEAIDQTMKTYGKKKAACEAVLQNANWLNAIILRPSVIYGKHDPTDRFYYWLRKIKKAKEIIIPNDGEDQLTLTYADDLVAILLEGLKGQLPNGAYNCSTHEPVSFTAMLAMMQTLLGEENAFYGMDPVDLRKEKIWLPLSFIGNLLIDSTKIKAATNLSFVSFEDSIAAMIKYYDQEAWRPCRVGIDEELEQATTKKDKDK